MSVVKPLVYRAAQLRGWALLGLLVLILAVLVGMIWRNLDRFETIRAHVSYAHRIMQTGLDLQKALTDSLQDNERAIQPGRFDTLARDLNQLRQSDQHFDPDTPRKLQTVETYLADPLLAQLGPRPRRTRLLLALQAISEMLDAETARREELLEDISANTRSEVTLASLTLAAILLVTVLFLTRRILTPLRNLRELLSRIALEDFSPIATRNLDPVLLPVFTSYNEMVSQLAELQDTKRRYAESLEADVRAATQALLEQQYSLARAERFAALGELAAGIAHELRNPLAGIQTSCSNLKNEMGNPEHVERLELIIDELKRMGRLLNDLLAQGKHTPAPARDFNLAPMLHDLVALTRYQVPSHIALNYEVPDGLTCHLPDSSLRQALLNLILNAASAIGPAPGEIGIKVHAEGEQLIIQVCDNGPGFSEEILKHGVRPFGTGRPGGTGLGLAMVQRFIREVNGRMDLANRPEGGARCTLIIPRHIVSAGEKPAHGL
ncbi:sensor histidine kinase [Methylococcus capsulatus str. Bath]|uniref:histidine kinase n=1 Tax=Methylococcus capsulatus (strain ATCC 33009 / NCIMB 11132 / Bath) TaxID=243233 RepID=Q604R4_METCA|nr:ATP-binding protein [Methylococcus capsulatus]AAU91413.1 sensor histidine kinase [Methylococcus capsulatus str. Bath]